ncbi:hypothetical protein ACFTWF_17965 [Rhodococcus sp. NPDC056960]|uniref:hypothetical protein n=1 Tax=Rhodococcus sp. NPDC056960 TaxID=3345982 RepID=UPI00363B1A30
MVFGNSAGTTALTHVHSECLIGDVCGTAQRLRRATVRSDGEDRRRAGCGAPQLGLPADARDFCAPILRDLGTDRITLPGNNPTKAACGITIAGTPSKWHRTSTTPTTSHPSGTGHERLGLSELRWN